MIYLFLEIPNNIKILSSILISYPSISLALYYVFILAKEMSQIYHTNKGPKTAI